MKFIKTNFFLKKGINDVYKKNNRPHSFKSFDAVRDVVLFFDYQDYPLAEKIILDLKGCGKQVSAWTVDNKEKTDATGPQFKFLPEVRVIEQEKDLSWKQMLQPPIEAEFDNLRYDTLFDFTVSGKENCLTYLLMKNKSSFCIGIKESEKNVYDCIILKDEDKDILYVYEQIKFYLNYMFGSSNNL
ncbi:hypothetical protein M2132_001597 [Dysgonomonas sp. PH5-45]|uniref:DUF6913 domain-containing protein n=1 Tax=unclassified Dysgonomonas TaxID=2630389 RepID=UPI002475C2D8|nr:MULTISPECIES: hypothetical protein [unclassified Dysgonomonas]MDH6355259.1 hypothetical protein [Dysgonomonas sp. PH5-45]MDH6388119.1 hypothetical protein [Dysgonomonas sp. PH5-37]